MQIHNLPEKTAIADSDVFAVDNGTTNNKVKTSTLGKKVTEDGAPAYTCNDVADGQATAWTAVAKLVSGEALKTTLSKLSLMFKNVRYLYKLIGTTNIAALSSDGTITGALSKLNTDINDHLGTNTSVGSFFKYPDGSGSTNNTLILGLDADNNSKEYRIVIYGSANSKMVFCVIYARLSTNKSYVLSLGDTLVTASISGTDLLIKIDVWASVVVFSDKDVVYRGWSNS